ncbi:MAG: sugar phosphate isomerase/epimerase [Rhizobacter sp.]|nr:sugar phosphate isomerase/epimerase [Ferruginibacter sp.]
MSDRRTFIKNSGLLTAGLLLHNDSLFAGKKEKIGLQMYTMRNVINSKNVAEVMARIAAIGYKELEIFGYTGKDKFWGLEPKPFKTLLKAHNLTAPAAHVAFENFLTGKDETEFRLTCEAAKIVGNKYIVIAWLGEKYRRNADDYKLIADKLNKAGIITQQYGLQLLYHNHDFEFTRLEKDTTGYDIIIMNADKQLVQLELDLYWAVKAGRDPVQLFKDNPGRFPLWHVKDMDKSTRSFTEAGAGIINFKQIFEHKKLAGLQHFFIEQDEVKKDVFESIRESFSFVKANLLPAGK